MRRRGVVLKERPDRDGYPHVCLYADSGKLKKSPKVANLIALAFIGPRPADLQVCHNDGDKANSRPGNLRYDTQSANQLDRRKHEPDHPANRLRCSRGHPYDEENTIIEWRDGRPTRRCRKCRATLQRARYRKRREQANTAA